MVSSYSPVGYQGWDNTACKPLGKAASPHKRHWELIRAPSAVPTCWQLIPYLSAGPRNPEHPRLLKGFIYLLFPGIRLRPSALSKVPLSSCCPVSTRGWLARVSGLVSSLPRERARVPLAPCAAVSQLENPFGEQSKSHTLLTAAPGRGQEKREEGIPTFAINCMQIGSFPGREQGASVSFMS